MIVPKSEAKQGSVVHFSDDEALYPEIYNFSQYTTSIARVHIGIEAFLVLVLAREQEPKTIYASKERANILFIGRSMYSV